MTTLRRASKSRGDIRAMLADTAKQSGPLL